MFRIRVFAALVFITLILLSTAASAENRPIQISLLSPIQLFPEDYRIGGVRYSLFYGKNATVSGLDLGFVNHTTTGLSKGCQMGVVGITDQDFKGFQWNWINMVQGNFEGFQWGVVVNYTHHANGLQLGIVNYAGSLKGVQIGIINIIGQGGQFPVFPFVNWSF